MHTRRRFAVLALASLAVTAPACRLPVFFPEFDIEPGYDHAYGASLDKDGEFVVSWTESAPGPDGPRVYGRRFSRLTAPLGPSFPVNADTTPARRGGSIARDGEGRHPEHAERRAVEEAAAVPDRFMVVHGSPP